MDLCNVLQYAVDPTALLSVPSALSAPPRGHRSLRAGGDKQSRRKERTAVQTLASTGMRVYQTEIK